MRLMRLCPISLAVGLAVFAGTPGGSAQERPKSGLSPQVPHSTKTTAAFGLPSDFSNWNPDIFDRNGITRFRQTNGNCQVTFAQNRGANAARATGGGPQKALDNYIDGIAARVGKVTRNKAPTLQIGHWITGKKVAFLSEEITYVGMDNVAYHNQISSQWLGNVELLIIAACPSADWKRSQDLLNAFLSQVSIVEMPE